MNIKILLADDHEIVREGLKELFEKQPDMTVIGEATDGLAAVTLTGEVQPDIVIMDASMPRLNGVEATRQITRQWPRVKVLALSMHLHPKFVLEMLKAGVSGYVDKNCNFDELVRAVRTVIEGHRYLSPAIADSVVEACVEQTSHVGTQGSKLTDQERRILQLLAEGKSAKETAFQMQLSVKTVEGYRRQIMDKLNLHSVAELTKYAILNGIVSLET